MKLSDLEWHAPGNRNGYSSPFAEDYYAAVGSVAVWRTRDRYAFAWNNEQGDRCYVFSLDPLSAQCKLIELTNEAK